MQCEANGKCRGAIRSVMNMIDNFRREHDVALSVAAALLERVDGYDPELGADAIVMQLKKLVAVLRVHLAKEDLSLYPRLMASTDPMVARTAQLYVDEMGGLAAEMEGFARHWSCSASIASSFEEFRADVHDLMLALAIRIERENRYLYPLAEQIAAGDQRNAA